MRKLMISLAAAGTALAFATPAAAQYYPQQSYGYGQQYGGYGSNGYGYNNYGQVRELQYRIDNVERQINQLDRRNMIRDRSADWLRGEANNLERRLQYHARNGLNAYEANDIRTGISRLEQHVRYAMANSYGRYGNYGYGHEGYGYNGYNGDYQSEHQRWHEQHDGDGDGDHDD